MIGRVYESNQFESGSDFRSCCFCDEFVNNTSAASAEFQKNTGLKHRVLLRGTYSTVFPTVSPLTDDHVLIIPNRHVSSITQCCPLEWEEILRTAARIVTNTRSGNANFFLFEHGVGVGREGGCGVSHAHLHIMHCSVDLHECIRSEVGRRLRQNAASCSYEAVRDLVGGATYLWMGATLEKGDLYVSDEIPSQLVRRVYSDLIGREYWDWREMRDWGVVRNTFEKFSVAAV